MAPSISDRPLCIIPARRGSRRFPGKHLAKLAGKPLVLYAIEAAQASGVFAELCVSSDDEDVLDLARAARVPHVLRRPPALAADDVPVKDVCAHLLREFAGRGVRYRSFGVLLATCPFRTAGDLQAAYALFLREDAGVCMSLAPYVRAPQRAVWMPEGRVQPYFGHRYMVRTQLLDPLYYHDGSIIFAKTEPFLAHPEFYGDTAVGYLVPADRAVDIDAPMDLAWAEFLMARAGEAVKAA